MFLAGHPNHQLVFMRIWQIEPTYLTDAFRDFYEENPLNITRILDVAQDLKVRSCLPSRPSLRTEDFLDTRGPSRSSALCFFS
jgi:CCR4-NOT transcription complex subunit 1